MNAGGRGNGRSAHDGPLPRLLRPVAGMAALFLGSVLWAATPFHSSSYGYHIDVPAGWVEIPRHVILERLEALQNEVTTRKVIYDVGFQPEAAGEWFDYPYVLVQPLSYGSFGVHRQINSDEFPEVIRVMTGLDAGRLIEEKLTGDAGRLIENLKPGRPQLDAVNRRFFWPMAMDVEDVGPVRAFVVGYFGREALVQVGFYCRVSDWGVYEHERHEILDSFRFDPDKAYSVHSESGDSSGASIWRSVAEKERCRSCYDGWNPRAHQRCVGGIKKQKGREERNRIRGECRVTLLQRAAREVAVLPRGIIS